MSDAAERAAAAMPADGIARCAYVGAFNERGMEDVRDAVRAAAAGEQSPPPAQSRRIFYHGPISVENARALDALAGNQPAWQPSLPLAWPRDGWVRTVP